MRSVLSITAILLVTGSSHATIHRVNNTGADADFITIQSAHDAATAGDTLHLEPSGSSYGDCSFTKALIVLGPGYFLGSNPQTQANLMTAKVDVIDFLAGSENSILSGVETLGLVTVSASYVRLERCKFATAARVGVINGLVLDGVVVNGCFSSTNGLTIGAGTAVVNNILVSNCRLLLVSTNGGVTNGEIRNNVFSYTSSGFLGLQNFSVSNNIFDCPVIPGTNNAFSNNLFKNSEVPATNGNQVNVDMGTVFIGGTGDAAWQLATGSPAIGAGVGGVDCGVFAGPEPYKLSGLPGIPSLFGISAPTVVEPGTLLPVQFSVRTNQ